MKDFLGQLEFIFKEMLDLGSRKKKTDIDVTTSEGFIRNLFYKIYPKFTWDIYLELSWIKKSLEILNEDNRICKDCGKLALEVHHLKSFYKYPEIALLRSNLISLCRRCHKIRHKNNKNYL